MHLVALWWFAERYNVNNAWNFNANNGNLNNNNVNNSYLVQGVVNLVLLNKMDDSKFFTEQMNLVFKVQKNKRRGRDSLIYENNIIALTYRAMLERINRTLQIKQNYAFLVSIPKWREIMATEFEGRKIDHEICGKIIPKAEAILTTCTFNNRIGRGNQAAIEQVIKNIYNVSEGYTKPTRCIKIDFKGYFPNALWSYADKVLSEVINSFADDELDKDYYKWLIKVAVYCDPASHCELRSPKTLWDKYIEPEKSILTKPKGVGAAIGRLIWQTAMGLYINDVIKWLSEECGLAVVVFVDDIVIIVSEERHQYALSLIPELRKRLKARNVTINENKFYDQPYQHGLEFLGSHIKPYRTHINNRTYKRALHRIEELNKEHYKNIDAMMSSFNSYSGLLKNRTDYKRLIELKDSLDKKWWKWLRFDEARKCILCREAYLLNRRLNYKYKLKLKRYVNKRNSRHSKSVIYREE